jgi:hypothetical protein
MVKRGNAAASASSETKAASLKDVYIACTEMTPSETGRPVESEGRWMKGSRKARRENGLEGLSLLTVSRLLRCQRQTATYPDGTNHVLGEKNPGISFLSTAQSIHRTPPSSIPIPREAIVAHPCQSQSPAQALMDDVSKALPKPVETAADEDEIEERDEPRDTVEANEAVKEDGEGVGVRVTGDSATEVVSPALVREPLGKAVSAAVVALVLDATLLPPATTPPAVLDPPVADTPLLVVIPLVRRGIPAALYALAHADTVAMMSNGGSTGPVEAALS